MNCKFSQRILCDDVYCACIRHKDTRMNNTTLPVSCSSANHSLVEKTHTYTSHYSRVINMEYVHK